MMRKDCVAEGFMTVLVVDADPMFRYGVTSLLQQEVDCQLVGEARNGAEALEKAQALSPDIVLMDLHLPGINGLEIAQRLKELLPSVKIVILTSVEQDEELLEALKAGFQGYLSKQIDPGGLHRTLRGLFKGEVALSRAATATLCKKFTALTLHNPGTDRPAAELSPREDEVLQLLPTEMSNKAIAASLGISENTVKSHLKRILLKLHLENRMQAVIYALRLRAEDATTESQET
jgi:DNA-binding NarL/FixJ family response regulator